MSRSFIFFDHGYKFIGFIETCKATGIDLPGKWFKYMQLLLSCVWDSCINIWQLHVHVDVKVNYTRTVKDVDLCGIL